ncbi:diaminopropionate ammonia-lyase [Clostridium sediminicola]|uniref:diaminopropionate ammonia-lyase n=1 Tax=Clostridium sediminicola TaxID=3114879 RepID=UPI0031F26DAA
MNTNNANSCKFIDVKLGDYNFCDFLTKENAEKALRFVQTQEDYKPTPLVSLNCLAKRFGVSKIYVKDESKRMGLNAFKGVGVFYGVARLICEKFDLDIEKISFDDLMEPKLNSKIQELVFVAATDGNHGKGLAWILSKLGCECNIYMPKNTTDARVKAIENLGANVTVTDGNYDETLRVVIEKAAENDWIHVQDQAWEGYTKVTNLISEGYTIIADETLKQMNEDGTKQPTHIILQAGAGSFAFGIMGYYANALKNSKPYMCLAEPENAACYYDSVINGKYSIVPGELKTVMAGLSVGEANIVAWEYLRTIVEGYASCSDVITARGMRILSSPIENDQRIISGESGALGLGLLSMICQSAEYKDIQNKMGIDENSVILVISTEGDTDPGVYEDIVWNGALSTVL